MRNQTHIVLVQGILQMQRSKGQSKVLQKKLEPCDLIYLLLQLQDAQLVGTCTSG